VRVTHDRDVTDVRALVDLHKKPRFVVPWRDE
jgi:hypothetical protein